MVALGIWWQRHEVQVNKRLSAWVPLALQPRERVMEPDGKTISGDA